MATVSSRNAGMSPIPLDGKAEPLNNKARSDKSLLVSIPQSDGLIQALERQLSSLSHRSNDASDALVSINSTRGNREELAASPFYSAAQPSQDNSSLRSTDTFGRAGRTHSISGTPASSIRTNGILRGQDSIERGGDIGQGDHSFDFNSDEEATDDEGKGERKETKGRVGEGEGERHTAQGPVLPSNAEVGRVEIAASTVRSNKPPSSRPPIARTFSEDKGLTSYSAANVLESCYLEPQTDQGHFYRRSGLRSDLREWAPWPEPSSGEWGGIKHLPDWKKLQVGDPTSRPIEVVRKDLEWSMQQLLNKEAFEHLIVNEVGRHKFRQYLVEQSFSSAIEKLDMYFDLTQYAKQNRLVCLASEGIQDVYLSAEKRTEDSAALLPEEMAGELGVLLKKQAELRASLQPLQQHLVQSLYRSEFQLFIKSQLVEHNKVKLGNFDDEDIRQTGLGDCYCLTNPRWNENPIVLVSPGFERVTGYPRDQIIGRNCRFLQGPGTARESIQRVQNAITAGESCTELLLNYRLDGTPFFCLLTIIPIHDSSGALNYFIGGQTNVSGLFLGRKGLSFLAGTGADATAASAGVASEGSITSSLPARSKVSGYEVSPSLALHLQPESGSIESLNSDNKSISSSSQGGESSKSSRSIRSNSEMDKWSSGLATERPLAAPAAAAPLFPPTTTKARRGTSKLFQLANSRRDSSSNTSLPKHATALAPPLSQSVLGAEGSMRKEAHSLEAQIEYFTSLYSKLIIFLRDKREIIYTTRSCLEFLGLPVNTWEDLHASPLMHADVLSIVQGSSTMETRSTQRAIQCAISNGDSISIKAGIKRTAAPPKRRLFGSSSSTSGSSSSSSSTTLPSLFAAKEKVRYTVLHITPLQGNEESAFAFVAVLS